MGLAKIVLQFSFRFQKMSTLLLSGLMGISMHAFIIYELYLVLTYWTGSTVAVVLPNGLKI